MASSLDILYEAHAEYESGGGKELPELISLVDTVFPQKGEQHAAWLQHFGLLGEAWREYHREGNMSTEWPKVRPARKQSLGDLSNSHSVTCSLLHALSPELFRLSAQRRIRAQLWTLSRSTTHFS